MLELLLPGVGWLGVGCWIKRLSFVGNSPGGRCDWIGLMHGEPSNGFPPGHGFFELMNHMLYVYVYIYIFTYTYT